MNFGIRQGDTWNPYRRLTLLLASSMLLFGLLLSLSVIWLVNGYVVRETVELTENAVKIHFIKLPQLKSIYDVQGDAGNTSDIGGNSYNYNNTKSIDSTHDGHQSDSAYDSLLGLVRMHFDLYNVLETNFYQTNGDNAFSYDQAKVGIYASNSDQEYINTVQQDKKVISQALEGRKLHLWIPILNSNGVVTGVVEMKRDITPQIKQAQLVQFGLIMAIFCSILLLFFALRRTFMISTRTIDSKNYELNKLVKTIERTYDESLTALSSALDSRDNETQGHSYRVTAYAVRLGKELGLIEDDLKDLARGALLHDVGKIGVPDAILRKPGGLTADEWVIMRSHVNIGYQMLQHIEFLKPALDVVRYHHERWDGAGYPYGLTGSQIPLHACIFAICDTYDAITSDRPYRVGRHYEAARVEIECCRGTQFNPQVVDAFLRIPETDWIDIEVKSHKPLQSGDYSSSISKLANTS
jgi:putative nucleotidyltransferase with HDIG domain